MDAGGPVAGADTLRELLQLYRDRDARDNKIRQLEQALADSRRVTPGGSVEDTGKLTLQLQKLHETLSLQAKQLDELRGIKDAHDATIAAQRVTLDESYATIGELKQSKAAMDLQLKQMSERNAGLVATADQLRLQSNAHELTISDLRKQMLESNRIRPRESISLPTPMMSEAGSTTLDGEEHDSERASLKAHIVDLSMKLHKASSEIATLQERLTSHQEENGSLQARIKELEDERVIEPHAERLSEVIIQRNNTAEALRSAVAERDASFDELSKLKNRLVAGEEQLATVQAELARISHARATLETDHAANLAELERVRSAVKAAEEAEAHDRAEMTARNSEQANEIAQLTADIARLEHEKDSVTAALDDKKAEITTAADSYAGEIKKREEDIKAALVLSATLESDLGRAREELAELAATRASLEASEGRVQILEADAERLKALATDIGNQFSAASHRIVALEPLEGQLTACRDQLCAAERRIEELNRQLNSAKNDTQTLDLLRKQVEDLRKASVSASDHVKVVERQLHSAQAALRDKDVEIKKTQSAQAAAEKQVVDLTTRIANAASNMPPTGADSRTIAELKNKINIIEAEKTVMAKNAQMLAPVIPGTEGKVTECHLRHTIQDIISSLTLDVPAKDAPVELKQAACRIWVTNMFEPSETAELPQSEVFLLYHSHLGLANKFLRLPAVEFFKACQEVYPEVVIEHRTNPTTNDTQYVVTGMAHRKVKSSSLPAPEPSAAAPMPQVKTEDKPADRIFKYIDQEVQAETSSGMHALHHHRRKPWDASHHLDFKSWLRHDVLGLSDADCIRPVARTPADSLRRYVFVKKARDTVIGLGWAVVDGRLDTYRVPKDSPVYPNAEFTQNAVLEAAGVALNVWEADQATFYIGAENAPRLQAWVKNPEDPALLGMFGNMSREELLRYKADAGRKRSRESVGEETPSSQKKHKGDAEATVQ